MALRLIRGSRARSQDPEYHTASEAPMPASGRSSRAWIMLVMVLGAAAVALLVVERSAGPPVSPAPAPALEGEPDIYMKSPEVAQYRPDGSLEYRLDARSASHYQGDDLTRLGRPRLTLYRRDGPPWTVTARHGSLRRPPLGAREETVALNDGVTLEQTRDNGERIQLTTPALRLYPQREYAETDRDVKIDSLFGSTTATGLTGDLQGGRLELRSTNGNRVHTILQPEQFK